MKNPFVVKVKAMVKVKVKSNVKFSALFKSVINNKGYRLKKLIWPHLTFKVKVMVKVSSGHSPRNPTTFISKVFLDKPYFQRYSWSFFKMGHPVYDYLYKKIILLYIFKSTYY